MEVWGTGAVRREFLFVDDAADGMVYLMQHFSDEGIVNLGQGSDVPIRDLVELICKVVGYKEASASTRRGRTAHRAR